MLWDDGKEKNARKNTCTWSWSHNLEFEATFPLDGMQKSKEQWHVVREIPTIQHMPGILDRRILIQYQGGLSYHS
jgi:hypothetical protein